MPADTARRDALLRLLTDWEAGRMTRYESLDFIADRQLWSDGYMAMGAERGTRCLTPAGLAAARAVKGDSAHG